MNESPHKFFSSHLHSHFSTLDGLSKPIDIISRAVDVDLYGTAITDHGSLNCVMNLHKARKKYIDRAANQKEKAEPSEEKDAWDVKIDRAKKLKLVNGIELYVAGEDNKPNTHLVILAKNLAGWKNLIKLTSESSRKENFFRKPRLSLSQLESMVEKGNLISFNGHLGTSMANVIFTEPKLIYNARTYEEAKSLVSPTWKEDLAALAERHIAIFGKDDFFFETQLIDQEMLPAAIVVTKALRWLSKQMGVRCLATADSHYPTKAQARDQHVIVCSAMKTSIPRVMRALENEENEVGLAGFFRSNNYHIPTPEEIAELNTADEIANSIDLADSIEDYSLSNKPMVPQFACPNGVSSDEYFRELCREGWRKNIQGKVDKNLLPTYAARIKHELEVLQGAGLSDYFLILADIADYVASQGKLQGVARGSVGGSLAAFLSRITALDPIPHNLIFERFYNAGRNTADRVALPDIDFDVQASFRPQVIQYIKDKYGHNRVAQIGTFGRIMGRGAIKEVLRVHEAAPDNVINQITQFIPDEAAIADELQEMIDEGEEPSIIKWALRNASGQMQEWCYLEEDKEGNEVCRGPYAKYFEQAIRLEGTIKSEGKHAAGVVITPGDISEMFPVRYDRVTGEPTISFGMNEVEEAGGVKMDILGISIMDKVDEAQSLIRSSWKDCI